MIDADFDALVARYKRFLLDQAKSYFEEGTYTLAEALAQAQEDVRNHYLFGKYNPEHPPHPDY